MTNTAKRIGTEWESRIVKFLISVLSLRHAARHPTPGLLDEGDVHVWPFVIQAKAQKRFALAEWVKATREQADRAHFPWSVVYVKAPGKPIGQGYAVTSIEEHRRLMAHVIDLTEKSSPEG